ncbi:hypothetical protein ACFZBM_27030 [Streptomyces lavendulae]|uniref:Uncharacterized protein n=1 Tax=Streptomyces lavendulae subsp. lavendulae TaxID=58340 RepID=A0A2K8PHM9_STRLA|nr:hypothetical protein [Streptomyces lavendulae]ATZ25273.1 hypothetical protein SLAV_17115 [Streptomyces lavendulae subsp. lavendulae]QUQ55103.1 hypothetical protein SLLC_15180 [Streptomyces lavendulae subsp. lavendulae]
MTSSKKFLMGLAAAGLAASSVIGGAGAAFAGSNGQQIVFHDVQAPNAPHAYSIKITGTNQNGQPVSRCFFTEGEEWYNVNGYWWVGQVSYQTYYNAKCTGATIVSRTAWIPKERTGDWVAIAG